MSKIYTFLYHSLIFEFLNLSIKENLIFDLFICEKLISFYYFRRIARVAYFSIKHLFPWCTCFMDLFVKIFHEVVTSGKTFSQLSTKSIHLWRIWRARAKWKGSYFIRVWIMQLPKTTGAPFCLLRTRAAAELQTAAIANFLF